MKKIIVGIALAVCGSLFAGTGELRTEKKLDHLVHKRKFLVTVFYDSKINSKQVVAQMQHEVKTLAHTSLYQQAGVFFILVDLSHARFDSMRDRYGVMQVPTVMLFHDGMPVLTEHGSPVIVEGAFSKEQLNSRILHYLGQQINDQAAHERNIKNREKDAFWDNYQNIYNGYPFDINIEYQRGPWYGYPNEGGPFVDFGV